jgi:hypothetical protein
MKGKFYRSEDHRQRRFSSTLAQQTARALPEAALLSLVGSCI